MSTFDPLRPDLLLGQQQVGGSTIPLRSRRGTGPIAGFTSNFALNLTNFDWVTWHSYEWENWVVVDALLQDALYGIDIRGAWQPNTDYAAGEIVIDTTTGEILLATTDHTSTDDIAADRTAELWQTYSVNEAFVGRGGDTMYGDLTFEGAASVFVDTNTPDVVWRLRNNAGVMSFVSEVGERLLISADDVRALGLVSPAPTDESLMTRVRVRADHYTKTEQDQRNTTVDQALNDRYTKTVIDGAFATRDDTLASHATALDNRYTKEQSDSKNLSQDQSIANNATAAASANTNANSRMRWRGDWVAGTYQTNDVVQDGDFLFIALRETTEKPDNGTNPPSPLDWDLLVSGGGSSVHVGPTAPDQPLNGDQWFSTETPVGLYVYIEDDDTGQWVEANGGSIADHPDVATKPMLGRRNLLINGAFDIWQRGTSVAAGSGMAYAADRWAVFRGISPSATVSRQSLPIGSDARNLIGSNYYARLIMPSGTDANPVQFLQRIEDVNAIDGEYITLSLWLRSSEVGVPIPVLIRRLGGDTTPPSIDLGSIVPSVANTFEHFVLTAYAPAESGTGHDKGYAQLQFTFGASWGSAIADFANVQLERGRVATPFERRPIGDEMLLCQRYFMKSDTMLLARGADNKYGRQDVLFPVKMRAYPTISGSINSAGATYPSVTARPDGLSIEALFDTTPTGRYGYVSGWSADAEL